MNWKSLITFDVDCWRPSYEVSGFWIMVPCVVIGGNLRGTCCIHLRSRSNILNLDAACS